MSRNKKAEVLHHLVTVALAMDKDRNMILSNEEIDELIQAIESVNGVRLKEKLLRKMIIDYGRSLTGIMEVARNLVNDNVLDDESLFSFFD